MSSLAYLGEGPGDPSLPPIFRPNWGPNGRKKFFGDWAPPLSQGLDDQKFFGDWAPHLISRSRSGTGLSPNLPALTVWAINSWSHDLGFKSHSESENLKIAIILGETWVQFQLQNIGSLRSVGKPLWHTYLAACCLIDLDSKTKSSHHCKKSNRTVQQRPLIGWRIPWQK